MTAVDWLSVLIVLGAGVIYAVDYARDRLDPEPPEGTTDHAEWLYATDEISHAELERRLDVYADPEVTKIRAAVERIGGIDTELSFAVAERYDTLTELSNATDDDLQRIHDIGPQRARAIRERFNK
jgi:hypothetical protein